ncbi:anthranilate synthase component I [Halobacteriales archaeon QH_2_66_30]|nr:MAG: anthranilate synthase component I [Halobacteriales archaeon QH_2_66_30]
MAGDRPAVVRVAVDIDADVELLEAYAALTGRTGGSPGGDYAYLLESAEKVASSDPDGAFAASGTDRHARFSFVGLPDVTLRGFPDRRRQMLDGGLVGFLAYEAVYDLWLEEVGVERPDSRYPDAEFLLTTKTLVFDHSEDALSLVFTPVVREDDDPGAIYDGLVAEAERVSELLAGADAIETGGFQREREGAGDRGEYEEAVERAREAVFDGEIYQGVISRKRELYGEVDALGLYEALREINPSPYMYLLAHDDLTIVGASPETLVSVVDGTVVSNPIAGTCPRGNSPVEDRRLAGEMLADGKERAEHTMLVDLARNDVRRVADPGSVTVEEFMNVLKYSHVQHIESTVTGALADDQDAFDAVRAAFPAGTLSGAPKIRAMELIDALEPAPRGPYGGGLGYVSWQGDTDFAIIIRTATVERLGDRAGPTDVDAAQRITVQAGAGIVADSDPAAEFEETEKKMDGVLAALERIEVADGEGERPLEADQPADGTAVSDSSGVGR